MATRFWVGFWAVLVLLATAAAAAADDAPAVIEVSGRGAVSVEPDTAVLEFTVTSNRAKASDTAAENARSAEKLMTALRALMDGDDKLRTAAYALHPVYETGDRLRPSGYRATNRVFLETRRIDRMGAFIDAAAEAGTGGVGGLQFKSSREAEQLLQAAALAVRQARETAEALAKAAGVTLTGVRQIRFAPAYPAPRFMAEAAVARSATPIEPGELTLDAEVFVVFGIE